MSSRLSWARTRIYYHENDKKKQGFPFNVYSILYESCVTSINDYAGEVIGFSQYERSVQLQARAIRAYLGLPKNSCRVGVLSEVDWLMPEYRTRLKMIRQYSRILKMDEGRRKICETTPCDQ